MAKAKTNPSRKGKLDNFKQSQKLKNNNMSEVVKPQFPEVRQIPVWRTDETITMNGTEFQAIYEAMSSMQQAAGVLQGIVTRSIIEEKIKLDFEKFDPESNTYVPMTDEEKAPHAEQVQVILNQIREKNTAPKEEAKVVTLQP